MPYNLSPRHLFFSYPLSPITYYLFSLDTGIRLKAFQFLDEQCKLHGDVLPRTVLAKANSGSPAPIYRTGGLCLIPSKTIGLLLSPSNTSFEL
jgi:hypothetical protein